VSVCLNAEPEVLVEDEAMELEEEVLTEEEPLLDDELLELPGALWVELVVTTEEEVLGTLVDEVVAGEVVVVVLDEAR